MQYAPLNKNPVKRHDQNLYSMFPHEMKRQIEDHNNSSLSAFPVQKFETWHCCRGPYDLDIAGIILQDPVVDILGTRPDYLMVTISALDRDYKAGGRIRFIPNYPVLLRLFTSPAIGWVIQVAR